MATALAYATLPIASRADVIANAQFENSLSGSSLGVGIVATPINLSSSHQVGVLGIARLTAACWRKAFPKL